MAHFYAFCTYHKKVGENRETANEAWADCNVHAGTPGPHPDIYVKQSSFRIKNGRKVFSYKKIRSQA